MSTPLPFPHFELRGSHRQVGQQHGEVLREKIREHLAVIYEKGERRSQLSPAASRELALSFVPYIQQYSPGFWEELQGLAEGAGIDQSEAVLLQVRQEVAHIARFGGNELECTTFAVSAPYTRDGATYAGQNADLSGNIEDFAAVLTFAVTGKPRVLMLVPAGQISYIGMNEAGISACANFLNCMGWRQGYPRYLLTRRALEQTSLDAALAAALEPPRASSRNLLLAARGGRMVDVENTTEVHAMVWGDEGCLAHANHYVFPELAAHESSTEKELKNSCHRYERMRELLEAGKGRIDLDYLKAAFRDHANDPDSICAHAGDHKESHTFASMINVLDEGRMELAKGPPCRNEYATYRI